MRAFFIAAALILICVLTIFAGEAASLAAEGCRLFFSAVFPALFPFIVAVGLIKRLAPMSGGRSSFPSLMLTLAVCCLSGAPSASLLLLDGSDNGTERENASVLAAFMNLSCPAFLFGTAVSFLNLASPLPMLPIAIGHYGSAFLLSGIWYLIKFRRRGEKERPVRAVPCRDVSPVNALTESVSAGVNTMLRIMGTLVFFYMLSGFFLLLPMPSSINPALRSLLAGLIEMTNGVKLIAGAALPDSIRSPLMSFLLTFGGASIMTQAFCAAKTDHTAYFSAKLVQACISGAITNLLLPIFKGKTSEVFAPGGETLMPRILTAGSTALMTFLCSAAAALICIIAAKRTRA